MKKPWMGIGLSILSIFMIGLLLVLGGCGKADEAQPQAIDPETDTCANCNMSVADDQYATELSLEDGKFEKFDDIGCMYKWKEKNPDVKIEQGFVRDFHSKEWIKEEDATYVYGMDIETPMSFHVISFKDEAEAKDHADSHSAEVMSISDLESHKWVKDMESGEHGM